jgi:hypothetical protein
MRRLCVVALLLMVGCAHKKPPPPPPPAPPPPPKGDTLRFKPKPGDKMSAKVRVDINVDVVPGNKKLKPASMALKFTFGMEEKVDAVAPDGGHTVEARLIDAIGETAPQSQDNADKIAQVLDELKINFKRQGRGEIMGLALSGLRNPLDDGTARQILNAIFGAQRGALFPETPVDVGGSWKTTMPLPESTGIAGDVHYDYNYARKDGGVAIVNAIGRFEGNRKVGSNETHSVGKSATEYRFDVEAGKMVSSSVDIDVNAETVGPDKETRKQHLHVEWAAEAPKAE